LQAKPRGVNKKDGALPNAMNIAVQDFTSICQACAQNVLFYNIF
jgi:hypothetical protein